MILFSTDNDLYEKLVNSTTNDYVKDDLEENILNLLISYDTVLGFKSIVLKKKKGTIRLQKYAYTLQKSKDFRLIRFNVGAWFTIDTIHR